MKDILALLFALLAVAFVAYTTFGAILNTPLPGF